MEQVCQWSWEAKQAQISEKSAVGDRVSVGYLADNDPHNYQEATITWIHPYWYYPDVERDPSKREQRWQVFVRFDDGIERQW